MKWEEWQPLYLDIVKRLNLSPAEDSSATALLDYLLRNIDPEPLLIRLEKMVKNRTVIVGGAGPSLEKHLIYINSSNSCNDYVYVAVDGAVSCFMELGYRCDLVVTDLDGNVDHIKQAVADGALAIVHAHGDNIEQIKEVVPSLDCFLGSTQVEPTERVFLWGGFTDGDRACYLLSHYNPKRIILAGMDFGDIIGRWSKPNHSIDFPASKRKKIKLGIAKCLLAHLCATSGIEFELLN